jgi:uncharacterized protein (TIGR02271 family)
MPQQSPLIVIDDNEVQRAIAHEAAPTADGEAQVLVRFNDGEQVILPKRFLVRQADGRYRLSRDVEQILNSSAGSRQSSSVRSLEGQSETGEIVLPVFDEFINVEKRVIETGRVELRKTVQERVEVVDQPIFSEEVEIERVAVNRPIDEVVPSRYEGETLIIPLVEEVLVVEKRLVLREEIHVRKLRTEMSEPQEVNLRSEQVEVVRKSASDKVSQDGA